MSIHFKRFKKIEGLEIDLLIEEWSQGDPEKGWVPAYKYQIVQSRSDRTVGSIDLRIGYQERLYYGGHIGYSVDEDYRGNHYAGKACRLLKQVALAHGMRKLIITCNPDNFPSRKTCEYVGAVFKAAVDLPTYNDMYQRGERQVCIFEWDLES